MSDNSKKPSTPGSPPISTTLSEPTRNDSQPLPQDELTMPEQEALRREVLKTRRWLEDQDRKEEQANKGIVNPPSGETSIGKVHLFDHPDDMAQSTGSDLRENGE